MAISQKHIEDATRMLVLAGALRVFVFGSAADHPETARDLDLACSGLPPERFYSALGELMLELPVPIDLIDLDEDSPLTRAVAKRARLVYERR